MNCAQHGQRHVTAVWIESEQAVTHAPRRSDAPVGDTQFMDQSVGVDVVEAITCRNIGRLVDENRSEVGVFAVEVDQVRTEMTLLQQEAGACKIVDPWTGLFRPCFVAIKPLPARSERHSWRLVDQRLMSRLVNDKAIDAVNEFHVRSEE